MLSHALRQHSVNRAPRRFNGSFQEEEEWVMINSMSLVCDDGLFACYEPVSRLRPLSVKGCPN